MINHCLKGFAAVALALAASACGSNMNISIGDDDGVPLSELDMSGEAPTALALASPDRVVIVEGDTLDIKVSGDPQAIEALRFSIGDGRLGIMRERDSRVEGKATVAITMPPAREIVLAGTGHIEAPGIVDNAEVNIAGSGTVAIVKVAAEQLDVNVMGSGTLRAAGTAERLDFNVAGSGRLAGRGLRVERAAVNIAGSGGGEFASDGRVDANVAGSGEVTVHGRADCKIRSMGSGRLRCVNGDTAAQAGAAPKAPPAPSAPDAPMPTE